MAIIASNPIGQGVEATLSRFNYVGVLTSCFGEAAGTQAVIEEDLDQARHMTGARCPQAARQGAGSRTYRAVDGRYTY